VTLPRKAGDLAPADYNPRAITRSSAQRLAESMRRFGDLSGIIYNLTTGTLIGGHQRTSQIPGGADITYPNGEAPGEDGETWGEIAAKGKRWPVRVVTWSEADEKAANIAANNPALQGDFVLEALADLLADDEVDLEATGFDPLEIEAAFDDETVEAILGRPSIMDPALELDGVRKAATELEEAAQAGGFADSLGSNIRRRAREDQEEHQYSRLVVCKSDEQMELLLRVLGYPPNTRYMDGAYLLRMLKGEGLVEEEEDPDADD